MNRATDEQLLATVATGDRAARDAAFGEFVERHRDRVHRLCRRYFRDATDAEDGTQEVFLRVLRHAGSFRGDAQATTWLHRVTINTCHDLARKRARRPSTAVEDIGAVVDRLDAVPDPTEALPTSDVLRDALLQLDEETRGLLLLSTVEGMAYAEVAELYGIAVGTVKSRVHRARAKLVDILGDALDPDAEPATPDARARRPDGAPLTRPDARGPPNP